jgi:D-alanine--poly(phosphoribitol) ligase subunit 2
MKNEITELITDVLHDMSQSGQFELDDFSVDAPLFGQNGFLDSINLVSLIVAVEQGIEDRYAVAISLADEKAFSQKKSPFRSVEALAAYATELVEAEQ